MTPPTFFPDAKSFRDWLEANAHSVTALLVGFNKVGTGRPNMSWSESVDEALCFGWINAVRKPIDNATYSIRFTPRKPTSTWSAVSIAKVERLRTEGRMTRAGDSAFAMRTDAKSMVYAYEQPAVAEFSVTELRTFRRNPVASNFFARTIQTRRRKSVLRQLLVTGLGEAVRSSTGWVARSASDTAPSTEFMHGSRSALIPASDSSLRSISLPAAASASGMTALRSAGVAA
jgi:uncharacterized protein YdeI (YjbR/CyaY-like superfamily)